MMNNLLIFWCSAMNMRRSSLPYCPVLDNSGVHVNFLNVTVFLESGWASHESRCRGKTKILYPNKIRTLD
jgi:hypothetical protein